MDENQLLIALLALLDSGIASYVANPLNTRLLPEGLTSQRAFLSRQGDTPEGPAIIVNRTLTRMIGYPRRRSRQTDSGWVKTQGQRYESTYHIEALVPQSPAEPTAMSEADVLNVARFILTCDAALVAFRSQNVGLLRVTEIRSNYIEDDKDQNEDVPFFEITFTHRIEFNAAVPLVDVFKTVFQPV